MALAFRFRRGWSVRAAIVVTVTLAGCASVRVNKIDRATGKVDTEAPEGLRFYLPRPYLSVFEPFIVASDVFLAKGEMSADGNYVLLSQLPARLDAIANPALQGGKTQTMGAIAIDSAQVLARTNGPGGSPQGAPVVKKDAATTADAAASAAKGSESDTSKPTDSQANKGGVLNYKATNDNALFAVTPQPRYFNILWLPDFDEQYVVTAKAGLGNAGVTLGFGQGWSLQSLEAVVDNSGLAKPLLDFYGGVIGSLQKLATAKIEAPLALISGGPQGAAVAGQNAKAQFLGGTPLTVKITKVRVVAPSLYPILKPKEIDGLSLDDKEKARILVPKPPLTNVAFNTYDVIVIEAARTTGDSALRIHQYVDSTVGTEGSAATSRTAGTTDTSDPLVAARTALRTVLSKPENASKSRDYFVPTLTNQADGTVKVELKKQSGGPVGTLAALASDADVKKLVIDTLKAASVVVTEDNVSISR